MPIEIKELHIKVAVSVPHPETAAPARDAGAEPAWQSNTGALIDACVEQVLEILGEKAER